MLSRKVRAVEIATTATIVTSTVRASSNTSILALIQARPRPYVPPSDYGVPAWLFCALARRFEGCFAWYAHWCRDPARPSSSAKGTGNRFRLAFGAVCPSSACAWPSAACPSSACAWCLWQGGEARGGLHGTRIGAEIQRDHPPQQRGQVTAWRRVPLCRLLSSAGAWCPILFLIPHSCLLLSLYHNAPFLTYLCS